jgi:hypothetical protein
MRAFRVDTDHITGAVENIQSAADTLGGGQGTVDDVDGSADVSMGDLPYVLKEEFRIIGEMLSGFKEALNKTSDTYNGADHKIYTGITTPPEAPSDPSGPTQAV